MAEASAVANGRNKYAVLDRSDEPDLDAGPARQRKPSASESERRHAERFVYTCAIFASLNAILLGYGEFLPLRRCKPVASEVTYGNGAFFFNRNRASCEWNRTVDSDSDTNLHPCYVLMEALFLPSREHPGPL
jgi:hypothetical protein